MSRFVGPDLAALGDVPALEDVDFEAIRRRRAGYLKQALQEFGVDYDVTGIETSPLMVAHARGGGYSETLMRQLLNEKVRALSLATARGGNLDHIAATYYGISRQQAMDEDGNTVPEGDERFRDRIALAPEAFSTAGPLGAYVFHALELDGRPDLADAFACSEDTGATYSSGLHADAHTRGLRASAFEARDTGDPVLAPEVLVVVLPKPEYGVADQALLDRVYRACSADDVRPLGDNVRIEPAQVVDYAVEMTVTYGPGADAHTLIEQVRARVRDYVDGRRRVGVEAERLGIGGAAYVTGVESVKLTSPAGDIGGAFNQVPDCTDIRIDAVQSAGSWGG